MKKTIALLLCALMVLSFIACGAKTETKPAETKPAETKTETKTETKAEEPKTETATEAKPEETKTEAAAGRYLDTLTAPKSKKALVIGTASSSGTWYIIGGAMANAVNNNSNWFNVTCEASSGGGENLRNLGDGAIDLAMLNSDMSYFYYSSTESYAGAGSDKLRAVFAMPCAAMHLVVRANSDVKTVADLKGKRIAVGLQGSGYELFASKVVANAGLTYDDMTVQMINPSQMPEALQNNQVDAFFFPVNVPGSALTELALNTDIRLLSLDDEFRNKFQSTYTGYVDYVIPANTYKGQTEDVHTLATGQLCTTLADTLTEDEAYVLMCDIFDNRTEWEGAHYTTNDIQYDNFNGLIIPLHAGVYKYMVEKGVAIPENLVPPEAK